MRKFEYRAPRFPVNLTVQVTVKGDTWESRCTEISTEGMCVSSQKPMTADSVGSVLVTYKEITLAVAVRVVHCGSGTDGLQFLCKSEEQREDLLRFVELLTAKEAPGNPILLR